MLKYSWQDPYLSALLETEDSKLYGRILEVRSALEQRLLSPVDDEELRAMSLAVELLDELERKAHPLSSKQLKT
jgi:hypothetical protein